MLDVTKVTYVFSGNWTNPDERQSDIISLMRHANRIHKGQGYFEGITEEVLVVEGDINTEKAINDMAFEVHTQTSILKIYSDNKAFLVESDSDREFFIGTWQKVDVKTLGIQEHYTRLIGANGEPIYYVCR